MSKLTPISYTQNQYDRISDDLCYLSNNVILKMNVSLSRNTDNYGRVHYHKEFEYISKYNEPLITVRRSFDYYLSIENIKASETGEKEFIRIGINDIILLRDTLKKATRWFTDKEFENLFVRKDGRIVMYGRPEPIYMSGLAMQKSLIFEPVVINYNEDYDIGVRIYLSSINNYADMRLNNFMGFVYLINSINLYESAQLLINYLQRPEFGTNLYSFNGDSFEEDVPDVIVKSNRMIKTRSKSYFDKD